MKTTISSGSKPEIVGSKIVDQTADTLGSQINISIFLGLLILTVFVMPSIGFGSKNERWHSNIVFSILIGAGIAIAWRRHGLFLSSQQLSASSHLCSVQRTGCRYSGFDDFMDIALADLP